MMTWAWNAIEKLDWPVLTLEVRRLRRSKGMFGWALPVAVVLNVIVVLTWLTGYEGMQVPNGPSLVVQILGWTSMLVLGFILWILVYLTVPVLTSRAISSEREAGTLQALAMTPLSSRAIILQKMALPIMVSTAVAVVSLPAAVVIATKVGAWPLIVLLGIPFMAALYAAVGACCSSSCKSSRTSAVAAILMAWWVLPTLMRLPWDLASRFGAPSMVPALGAGMWVDSSSPTFLGVCYDLAASAVLAVVLFRVGTIYLDRLRRAA